MAGGSTGPRRFLGVRLDCAAAYVRAYPNRAGTEYLARCPKCLKSIRFPIGPGGTGQRMFVADCGRDARFLA